MSKPVLNLTAAQRDRAVGVLIGMAAGDALGAGYEFNATMTAEQPVDMIGGGLGPFAPGEWTDDTSMGIAIAEIAATGADLCQESSLDYIVERWCWWARTAKDVGVQTSSVLSAAGHRGISARTAREESAALHARTSRTAGNGSLMRTAPVALAYLDDSAGLITAARAISALTHFDRDAGDACVLWCAAIRHAVLTGSIDIRVGLDGIDADRRGLWASRLDEAEQSQPAAFSSANGWVVAALQGAWSAIATTPVPVDDPATGVFGVDHLRLALEAAVRGGGDTDTVAAIAGGLLGAAYGASAVPARWRLLLKGWPGLKTRGLVGLANRIIDGGQAERFDHTYGCWRGVVPPPVRHPHDEHVWLGEAAHLHKPLPAGVDAVVSLCRVADGHTPEGVTHLDVRLIDQVGHNDHLDFVLLDTVRAIEQLRADGHTVFVHCLQAHSRTPAVAALYGARRRQLDVDQALREVCAQLPEADPNPDLREALRRLHPGAGIAVPIVGPQSPAVVEPSPAVKSSTTWSADTWWAYWDVMFPPRPVTPWVKWKQNSTGVNIARRFWDQREHLRRVYEAVHGADPDRWPSRHPGVVLDAVPSIDHAGCLGCQWFDTGRNNALQAARRHETDNEPTHRPSEEHDDPTT